MHARMGLGLVPLRCPCRSREATASLSAHVASLSLQVAAAAGAGMAALPATHNVHLKVTSGGNTHAHACMLHGEHAPAGMGPAACLCLPCV